MCFFSKILLNENLKTSAKQILHCHFQGTFLQLNTINAISFFQKIIKFSLQRNPQETKTSATSESVSSKLLKIIQENDQKISKDTFLLTSHAFFLLLYKQHKKICILSKTLQSLLQEAGNDHIRLTICYGFLHLNDPQLFTPENGLLMFDLIYPHCMSYTRDTFFAFKILYHWLLATSKKSDFWTTNFPGNDSLVDKVQTVIFSNWDNAIEDLAKYNAGNIFPLFLSIKEKREPGFLEKLFSDCVDRVSWGHVTKYVILAEICKVWDNVEEMTKGEFLDRIFDTLEDNLLRNAGTTVYKNVAKKLSDGEWERVIGGMIVRRVNLWNKK